MSVPRCKHYSSHGKRKQKYRTFDHAYRTAERRGWTVDVYPCPSGQRHYHITHKTPAAALVASG